MDKFSRQILNLGIIFVVGVVLLVLWADWSTPRSSPPVQPKPPAQEGLSSWRTSFSEADLDLLARVVRAEAQGEPYDGQIAVAAVILNRVRHPEFPNTIPGVVYEPLAFTVVSNGQVNKPADASAIQAAHAALNGLDPTGGALFFYNPAKTRSGWVRSRHVVKTIGKHVFAS